MIDPATVAAGDVLYNVRRKVVAGAIVPYAETIAVVSVLEDGRIFRVTVDGADLQTWGPRRIRKLQRRLYRSRGPR